MELEESLRGILELIIGTKRPASTMLRLKNKKLSGRSALINYNGRPSNLTAVLNLEFDF